MISVSRNQNWVGIDIGGANIKIAGEKTLVNASFPLWKFPEDLAATITDLLQPFEPFDRLAVTMTGELADCFENKKHGVGYICQEVQDSCEKFDPVFYQVTGDFVREEQAVKEFELTAAANWHALASAVGCFKSDCLVLDIGSTTTDILSVTDGRSSNLGSSDFGRLLGGELYYTGVTRTPVAAVTAAVTVYTQRVPLVAETFATMKDVYIILDKIVANPEDTDTADMRPATLANSQRRLARMLCSDVKDFGEEKLHQIAQEIASAQSKTISNCVDRIVERNELTSAVVSGSGAWLAEEILADSNQIKEIVSIEELSADDIGMHGVALVGPAWAVKHLAETQTSSASDR